MRRHNLLPRTLLVALAFASSCSEELPPPEPDRPTIDERTFTATLSDLVVARIQLLPDTAAYTRRAEEILREQGVSEDDLRTFVEVHGHNDDLLTAVLCAGVGTTRHAVSDRSAGSGARGGAVWRGRGFDRGARGGGHRTGCSLTKRHDTAASAHSHSMVAGGLLDTS